MENRLILTNEPFIGYTPEILRTWLHTNREDKDLASALAEVHNHTGCLGQELDETDDKDILTAYNKWWTLEKELYELVITSMRQSNLSGKTNYDLDEKGLYHCVKPFMEANGYGDGSGWWIKSVECSEHPTEVVVTSCPRCYNVTLAQLRHKSSAESNGSAEQKEKSSETIGFQGLSRYYKSPDLVEITGIEPVTS